LPRALDAGVPAGWVAGDEVYGTDPQLRADLENRETGYVLAVARRHTFTTGLRASRADHAPRRLCRQHLHETALASSCASAVGPFALPPLPIHDR
jgi:SRSO17 transposase